MATDERTTGEKIVDKILNPGIPWKDAFNLAHLPGIIDQQKALQHSRRRHESQVDAMLKAKYQACGMDYEPPEEEVGDTYINCPVISDRAIGAMARAAGGTPGAEMQPGQQPQTTPWWSKLLKALMLLAAVTLGALLVWWTLQQFGGGQDSYEIIAVPFDPNT